MLKYRLAVLDCLATDPKHQGRGAGTMLIRWGLEIADAERGEVFLPTHNFPEMLLMCLLD